MDWQSEGGCLKFRTSHWNRIPL